MLRFAQCRRTIYAMSEKSSWLSKFGGWLATLVIAPIVVGVVLWRLQQPKPPPPGPAPQPILRVLDVSPLPRWIHVGDPLLVAFTVNNEGSGVAHECRGNLRLTNVEIGVDKQVNSAEFGLAPGERHAVSLQVLIPDSPPGGSLGVRSKITCNEGETEVFANWVRTAPAGENIPSG